MSHRVLMIAWHYYPSNTSGAHRPAKFAKYLPEFGWTPTVLCAEVTPDNCQGTYDPTLVSQGRICETIRVPYPAPRRRSVGSVMRRLGRYVVPCRGPLGYVRRMVRTGVDLVEGRGFDAVWSTAPPCLTHYVAGRVVSRRPLPWVADFRDLQDQSSSDLLAKREASYELKVSAAANDYVVVSRPLAKGLATRSAKQVHVIHNGFDPADYTEARVAPSEKFVIAYMGILHAYMDPRPLMEALDRLAEVGEIDLEDVEITFHGASPEHVKSLAQGYRSAGVIACHERVPFAEMVRVQKRATVLLVLSCRESPGIMTGKIFGYLGAERPVLDIPGGGVTTELLEETGVGQSASTPEQVAQVLRHWYREWKQTGSVAWKGRRDRVERYSWREHARRLAEVLDSCLSNDRSS